MSAPSQIAQILAAYFPQLASELAELGLNSYQSRPDLSNILFGAQLIGIAGITGITPPGGNWGMVHASRT